MKVLFNKNITAVAHQAILESQNRYWPMSHTSRISGWRKQNRLLESQSGTVKGTFALTYQMVSDVYSTTRATKTVRMRPGTRPKTEYAHGNDIIARHMYSEKSNAAVYSISTSTDETTPG